MDRYSAKNINSATTTVIKSRCGYLHTLTVNSTAAGSITIYDGLNTSGSVIAVLKASIAEQTFIFDVGFSIGLTIVTAAASDITISYS